MRAPRGPGEQNQKALSGEQMRAPRGPGEQMRAPRGPGEQIQPPPLLRPSKREGAQGRVYEKRK
eukprot:gene1062-1721_t